MDTRFTRLIREGLDQELVGWDMTWLDQRTEEEPLPWDYRALVLPRVRTATAMLDYGTGGGEVLASLAPFPAVTWATEGYPPNVPVARRRLEPLGVRVADISDGNPILPFESGAFDLVINRHSGLRWSEIGRVLRPGGQFITQQVGGENCMAFNRFFQPQPYFVYASWTLAEAVRQFTQAGMRVTSAREAFPRWVFKDIAAVVYYLKIILWQIEDFSVTTYEEKLYQLHRQIERDGGFAVHQHRMLVEAELPAES